MAKGGEPPKKAGNNSPNLSNLMTTRNAVTGSVYETWLANEDEGLNTPSYGSRRLQKREEEAMNEQEAIAFVQRVAGVDAATAKELNAAVWHWTGSAYSNIRKVQQGDTKGMSKQEKEIYQKWGDNVERYIERAAKWGGGETMRGIRGSFGYKAGDEVSQDGTASWSTKEHVARSFAGNGYGKGTIFISQTQSYGTSTNFSHQFHSEHEVTVSRKARYIVERTEQRGSIQYVWVREK